MKIVFLNATGQLGGAERVMICMLRALREARPEWNLQVVTADDGPLIPLVLGLGFDISILPMPSRLAGLGESASRNPLRLLSALAALLRYRRELRRVLERMDPDIVHSINFKMHVLGAWTKPPGAKLCWHIHDFVHGRMLSRKLLRALSGKAEMVIAISHSVARDFREATRFPARIRTVLNAIDLDHFSPSGPAMQLEGAITVGLVATFARWKGHDVFLRALAALPRHIRGYIAGGSLYRTAGSQHTLEDIRRRAEALGVLDRVAFTGFLEDTAPLMRGLDIVVHASTEPEPFGLAIAEGMACGRAVVASMAGGAKELMEPGVTGLGHAPGDAAGLAQCIARLAESRQLRRQYGEAARNRAEALFQPSRMARELIAVYEQ